MFLPLLSYHWWYATIYVFILLLFPMLVCSLNVLTRRQHFTLVCLILFIGPVMGAIPGLNNAMINDDLFEMLCLLVLVSRTATVSWVRTSLSGLRLHCHRDPTGNSRDAVLTILVNFCISQNDEHRHSIASIGMVHSLLTHTLTKPDHQLDRPARLRHLSYNRIRSYS